MDAKERVQGYRVRQRASGLRLIHLWVTDTRSRRFAAECRRQCRLSRVAKTVTAQRVFHCVTDSKSP